MYENEVENQDRNYYMEPNSMTGGDGITFYRHRIEENEHTQQQMSTQHDTMSEQHAHKVRTIYLEKFPVDCKESTGYGKANGIPAKVTRDTGSCCNFISDKLVHEENYTGKDALVILAGGGSQIKPTAIVPVVTPFYTGNLTCIVSNKATRDLLIGNFNGDLGMKIGGCQFEKNFDDSNIKQAYEERMNKKKSFHFYEHRQNTVSDKHVKFEENDFEICNSDINRRMHLGRKSKIESNNDDIRRCHYTNDRRFLRNGRMEFDKSHYTNDRRFPRNERMEFDQKDCSVFFWSTLFSYL